MVRVTRNNVKVGMSELRDITKIVFDEGVKYVDWKNSFEYANKEVLSIALGRNCAHIGDNRLIEDGGVLEAVQCIKCLIEVNGYKYPFKTIPIEYMYKRVLRCSKCGAIVSKAFKDCFHYNCFISYSEIKELYNAWGFICKYRKINFIYVKISMKMGAKEIIRYYINEAKKVARDNDIYFIERG